MADKDAAYLVPRLRDLAFSVDIRYAHGSRLVVLNNFLILITCGSQ